MEKARCRVTMATSEVNDGVTSYMYGRVHFLDVKGG